MNRGLETASILGAGVLLTIGLMVFADWRNNQNSSEDSMVRPPSEQPLTEEAFQASLGSVEKQTVKPNRSKPIPVKMNDEEHAVKSDTSVEERVPIAEAAEENELVGNVSATEILPNDDPRPENPQPLEMKQPAEPVKDSVENEEEQEEPKEVDSVEENATVVESKPAASSATKELVLLEQAHNSLSQLHQMLLRADRSRARSKQEAEKLSKILDQLPKETQDVVRGWIKMGYERRVGRAKPTTSIADRSATSVSISEASIGQRDDTPADLKALKKRIHHLRSQVNAKARTNGEANSSGVRGQPIGKGIQATSP